LLKGPSTSSRIVLYLAVHEGKRSAGKMLLMPVYLNRLKIRKVL